MHRISAIFSRGSSSSSYDALDDRHTTNEKLHQRYSASALGHPGYQHRSVVVNAGTLAALADARWANGVVKNMLPHGAGNQHQDVTATSGEAWARMHLGYEKYSGGGITDQLKRAQKFQGGNCTVHAAIAVAALKDKGVSDPICRMRIRLPENNSHELVMLGDHRDRRFGERNTVVVDAWPTYPSASTLAQTVLHDARDDTHLPLTQLMGEFHHETWDASISANQRDINRLHNVEVMSAETLQRKLAKAGLPTLHSDALVNHALGDDAFGRFDIRVITDPSTHYTDGSDYGESFDGRLGNR